jgi:glutaredoxin 3
VNLRKNHGYFSKEGSNLSALDFVFGTEKTAVSKLAFSKPIITLYTSKTCPRCHKAKKLLKSYGIGLKEVNVENLSHEEYKQIRERSGRSLLPHVVIGGRHIGSLEDLQIFLRLMENGVLLEGLPTPLGRLVEEPLTKLLKSKSS